jgi:8-oxo-dGTP diphosphatase
MTLKVAPNNKVRKFAWILIRGRKVLFARSKSQDTLFYTVGGKPEEGETEEESLMRETLEETGVLLKRESIKHLHTFMGPCHGYVEGTVLEMHCYAAEPDGEAVASSEIAELAWLGSSDTHLTTPMGVTILEWLRDQDLID